MDSIDWAHLLFAAHGQASGAEILIGVIFVIVVTIVAAIMNANARYEVVIRHGHPYCPRCNRQVTYRRDQCRACGHVYKYYGKSPSERAAEVERAREEGARQYAREMRRGEIEWQERQRTLTNKETNRSDELSSESNRNLESRSSARGLILYAKASAAVLSAIVAIAYYTAAMPPQRGAMAIRTSDADPDINPTPSERPDHDGNMIVYVTRDGVRYHKDGCFHLAGDGSPMALRDAALRYAPCSECCLSDEAPKVASSRKSNRAAALLQLARPDWAERLDHGVPSNWSFWSLHASLAPL